MLEAADNAEITIKGKLEKVEGDIQLLYKDSDGNTAVLADRRGATETDISIDTVLNVQAGTGEIYFAGNSSICKFDITFSLLKNIKYYMHNDKTTLSMPPRFEIEMTLTKDWDDADSSKNGQDRSVRQRKSEVCEKKDLRGQDILMARSLRRRE